MSSRTEAFGYWPPPRKPRREVRFPTGRVLVGYGGTVREAAWDASARWFTHHPCVEVVSVPTTEKGKPRG